MPWLVRNDEVLAAAEIASSRRARRVGLRGRDHLDGVLVLDPCKAVHTFGMRFPIDVIYCDRAGTVVRTATMAPRRVSLPVWSAAFTLEARAGFLDRWAIVAGDVLEVRR